ncbi:gluconate kinase, partial [Paenibacillus sepulcri]|nr:gluconate kinase [Paenibacillus sepulcri]
GLIAEAVERSIREVMRKGGIQADEVACLTFSSAMHGLIAVDGAGEALTPCVTWADLRAAGYAKKLRDSGEAGKLTMRTGVPVHAMTPLCKLLWLRDNEPEIFASARCFIGIKEFVLHRWFEGPYLMDESVAGGTGLYHLEDRKWDEQALQLAGVGLDKLPQLVPSEHVLQGLRQAAADAMLLS